MTVDRTKDHAGWKWDNSYARLDDFFYSRLQATPVREPEWVKWNEPLAVSLGLDVDALRSEEGAAIFAGNRIPEGAEPLAQAYAGHQFGHFTTLGDGRALLLGEQLTPSGERMDIQLKGSGRTPYSRGGDGRAALGPMLREYIISEAMHALGIPTTRSLAVVRTGEPVIRETALQGAVLTRVAASHLRVGTFQYAAARGTVDHVRALADYTLHRHFPAAVTADGESPYLTLLQEVIKRQAMLIAQWQLVGFIHGVMNTDNMALGGETIDYGPCAFMDTYDPATVFSSIDTYGRYAYGNQPAIAGWNLARFAETLLPLLHDDEDEAVKLAEQAVGGFAELYEHNWLMGMRGKLGIWNAEPEDESLIEALLGLMQTYQADYTNTFRALTTDQLEGSVLFETPEFAEWHKLWQERLTRQPELAEVSRQLMRNSNPVYIPRNHRVEEALAAAVDEGDYSVMDRLLAVLTRPYEYGGDPDATYTEPTRSAQPYRTFCGT